MADKTQALFTCRGANLQNTADQTFEKVGGFVNYKITSIEAVGKTGGATVACLGGIYTAAAKTGNILVAATQSWLSLSGVGKVNVVTLGAPITTDVQSATPILSLSTGSTAAAIADLFVFGVVLD